MAKKTLHRITDLPSASTPLSGGELFEIAQRDINGTFKSRKVSYNDINPSAAKPIHNSTLNKQGGILSAGEFYHLSQSIHDALFSASPLIGLGRKLGTNFKVDYGLHRISADINGVEGLSLNSGGLALSGGGRVNRFSTDFINPTNKTIPTTLATRTDTEQASANALRQANDYTDSILLLDVISGRESLSDSSDTNIFVFDIPQPDTNYTVVGNFANEIDADPQFHFFYIKERITTGFTIICDSPMDTANYKFDWILSRNKIESSSSSSSSSSLSSSSSSSSTSSSSTSFSSSSSGIPALAIASRLKINSDGDILLLGLSSSSSSTSSSSTSTSSSSSSHSSTINVTQTFGENSTNDWNGVTESTFIVKADPNITFGEQYEIIAGDDSGVGDLIYRTLIKIDIANVNPQIGGPGDIISAKMKLWCFAGGNFFVGYSLYKVNAEWHEAIEARVALTGDPTWLASRHYLSNWEVAGCNGIRADREGTATDTVNISGDSVWYKFDITQDVKSLIDNYDNYGWILVADNEESGSNGMNFFGSKLFDDGQRPYIEIEFDQVIPPIP